MRYNCDSEDYERKVIEWVANLKTFNREEYKIGEIYATIISNTSPVYSLIHVTKSGDTPIVLFQSTSNAHDIRVYEANKIEVSFKDYHENHNKRMLSFRVDDKFWMYEERFAGVPVTNGGIIGGFGMDMDMPFLQQQNFKLLEQ